MKFWIFLGMLLFVRMGLALYTYSHQEILAHKNRWIALISSQVKNLYDPSYQMARAIKTIQGIDADYIPKVAHAGEIFSENGISYQVMHNGVKVLLNSYYNVQWITDVIYGLRGHHEPQEEKCFYEVLKYIPQNATMLELGSFWAYYSLWFAAAIEGAKNYLIEPDPSRLAIGEKNFELNNKSAHFERGYVGIMQDNEPNYVGAPLISIDDFLDKEGITHLNILHADVQGAEFNMLQSAVKHLQNIDYFFISTHGEPWHSLCLNFFIKHGFSILAQHTDRESCSGDGLLVAKRRGAAGPDYISIKLY